MRLGQRVVGWTVKPTAGKVTAAMDITAYNALVLWIMTSPNWHQGKLHAKRLLPSSSTPLRWGLEV